MENWYADSHMYDAGYELDNVLSTHTANPRCNERNFDEGPYPAPTITLESNSESRLAKQFLATKTSNQCPLPTPRLSIDRPYLRSQKYIDYRERKRQDIGKDGKPVWPDHVEASFQNALIWIPPMGRRKKPQNGKPHGRNELIAEWIFQETGEVRDRKQVSSHIQVLGNLLKHIPEWQALTTFDNSGDDEYKQAIAEYSDSIADIVRYSRQLRAQNEASQLIQQPGWQENLHARPSLAKLQFDMWVGGSETIHEAIHTYSRIQNVSVNSQKLALEDFRGWRHSFPGLEPLLQSSSGQEYDLILLKCNVDLMSDFPPPDSKLGLLLELDFRRRAEHIPQAMNDITSFSCTNTFYHDGQMFREKHHDHCKASEAGVVRPFFEVDWWAAQFTKLTQKRKSAEYARNSTAVSLAKEFSSVYFRGLTMMQVIDGSLKRDETSSHVPVMKRMAVLLWTFSQAPDKRTGVTQWQKLIPPPSRDTTNSPLTPSHVTNPPLTLSSSLENAYRAGTHCNATNYDTSTKASSYPTLMYPEDDSHQGLLFHNSDLTAFDHSFYNSVDEIGIAHEDLHQDLFVPNSDLTAFDHPFSYSMDQVGMVHSQHGVSPVRAHEHHVSTIHRNADTCAVDANTMSFDVSLHQMSQARTPDFSDRILEF